ncbi:MAG: YbaB/EbfC family nucleoid-associated protein [Deferribacterota bacterium]|nr:YbaB/EbfC family nucleoid-associated protein [Deferribacterota bacterium]
MNMQQIMKQAQKVQQKMKEIQDSLVDEKVEASSGGGMVNVVVNGRQEVVSVKIEPEILEDNDLEMLQDLIMAAVNEGIKKSQAMVQEKLSTVTGGMNIPGLF